MVKAARTRLTRQQRQLATKEQLLESAHDEIVQGGVMAISIRGICEAAGYSQGAFYSNFASRDELVLMVMERHVHEEALALQALSASMVDASLDDALTILAERLAALSHETQWSLLAIELQLFAQRDPRFAAAYNHCKSGYHSEFAMIVSDIVERHGLGQEQLSISGWAMEARLYAENPVSGFLPSTGRLDQLRFPAGIRVDSGVEEGGEVTPYYDPMIAKLVAHGPTRGSGFAGARGRRHAGLAGANQCGISCTGGSASGLRRRPGRYRLYRATCR